MVCCFVACLVCVGALFINLSGVLMINDVLLSGCVLCCCAFARVGFNVCSLCLMYCVVSSGLFLSVCVCVCLCLFKVHAGFCVLVCLCACLICVLCL